ncbi:MAG: hypothetical protein EXS42_08810 [Lacunisphaera sp.]|nr:hypothetical protein [Lacunisphaera sp.]
MGQDSTRQAADLSAPTTLTRRDFLGSGALAGSLPALSQTMPPSLGAAESVPAGPRRLSAHRNLFNGDCNFLFYNPELWQPEGGAYSARAIHRYLGTIADSGVDTLLINPNTQVAWYPTKKLEYLLQDYRRGDVAFTRSVAAGLAGMAPELAEKFARNMVEMLDLYLDLAEAGVDWLAECARACRARGISPWLSYRMNPTHFSSAPESPVNCRLFRDPRNRLSGRVPDATGSTQAAWVGLNYGQPAVRDHMFAMIREGVESHDYEGLELDWLRHPLCLEAPASQKQIDGMTDWFAAIRALTKARRPDYILGVRAPANLPYLRSIGIDLKALARRGLIDCCTFSNFWQTSWEMPLDELRRELGPDLAIYGGMEDAPNWLETHAPSLTERPAGPDVQLAGDNAFHAKKNQEGALRVRGTRYLTASAELIRANAAGKLVLGADGLEQFNFFVTDQVRVPGLRADYSALRRLADLEFLRGQEKHYAFNTASVLTTKIWDVAEQLPVRIAPRQRRALRLPMCAEPAGADLMLVVQLVLDRAQPGEACGISLNGAWPVFERTETGNLLFPAGPYTRHVEEHRAWNYILDCGTIRDGWNEIVLYNESAGELSVAGLELGLKRRGGPVENP